uniref:Uncharacterized protein n=1 Tax=Timema cristinae TaxID=61476 RepID=A0A7R9GUX5_TIMCR|nr:unnamed protein product [Timema cristinae]
MARGIAKLDKGLRRFYLEEMYPHLHGWRVENVQKLSEPYRDYNLDLPVISSLIYCESSALDHAATEAGLGDCRYFGGADSCGRFHQERNAPEETIRGKCTRISVEGEWKTIMEKNFRTPHRDSNLNLPISSRVYCEISARPLQPHFARGATRRLSFKRYKIPVRSRDPLSLWQKDLAMRSGQILDTVYSLEESVKESHSVRKYNMLKNHAHCTNNNGRGSEVRAVQPCILTGRERPWSPNAGGSYLPPTAEEGFGSSGQVPAENGQDGLANYDLSDQDIFGSPQDTYLPADFSGGSMSSRPQQTYGGPRPQSGSINNVDGNNRLSTSYVSPRQRRPQKPLGRNGSDRKKLGNGDRPSFSTQSITINWPTNSNANYSRTFRPQNPSSSYVTPIGDEAKGYSDQLGTLVQAGATSNLENSDGSNAGTDTSYLPPNEYNRDPSNKHRHSNVGSTLNTNSSPRFSSTEGDNILASRSQSRGEVNLDGNLRDFSRRPSSEYGNPIRGPPARGPQRSEEKTSNGFIAQSISQNSAGRRLSSEYGAPNMGGSYSFSHSNGVKNDVVPPTTKYGTPKSDTQAGLVDPTSSTQFSYPKAPSDEYGIPALGRNRFGDSLDKNSDSFNPSTGTGNNVGFQNLAQDFQDASNGRASSTYGNPGFSGSERNTFSESFSHSDKGGSHESIHSNPAIDINRRPSTNYGLPTNGVNSRIQATSGYESYNGFSGSRDSLNSNTASISTTYGPSNKYEESIQNGDDITNGFRGTIAQFVNDGFTNFGATGTPSNTYVPASYESSNEQVFGSQNTPLNKPSREYGTPTYSEINGGTERLPASFSSENRDNDVGIASLHMSTNGGRVFQASNVPAERTRHFQAGPSREFNTVTTSPQEVFNVIQQYST